jgi:heme/copper-type cytochrome/quinol oxidase subunit 3
MADMMNKVGRPSETAEEREYEMRAHVGSVWSGGRLFIGMYTFLVASLVFSYYYLRSSNNGGLWRPHHVMAPRGFGFWILAFTLAAALFAIVGRYSLRRGDVQRFRASGWTAFGLAFLALVLQCWQTTIIPFYPGSSGYASTFVGWEVLNISTLVICAYWTETTQARGLRIRRELGGTNPELSSHPRARSFRADVSSMSYFMGFAALVSALGFGMFYF